MFLPAIPMKIGSTKIYYGTAIFGCLIENIFSEFCLFLLFGQIWGIASSDHSSILPDHFLEALSVLYLQSVIFHLSKKMYLKRKLRFSSLIFFWCHCFHTLSRRGKFNIFFLSGKNIKCQFFIKYQKGCIQNDIYPFLFDN